MENCKQTDLHQYFEKQIDPQKQRANNDPHRRFEEKIKKCLKHKTFDVLHLS